MIPAMCFARLASASMLHVIRMSLRSNARHLAGHLKTGTEVAPMSRRPTSRFLPRRQAAASHAGQAIRGRQSSLRALYFHLRLASSGDTQPGTKAEGGRKSFILRRPSPASPGLATPASICPQSLQPERLVGGEKERLTPNCCRSTRRRH